MGLFHRKKEQTAGTAETVEKQVEVENMEHIRYSVDVLQKKIDKYMQEEVDITYCMQAVEEKSAQSEKELDNIYQVISNIGTGYHEFNAFAGQIDAAMEKSDLTIQKANGNMEGLMEKISGSRTQLDSVTNTFGQLEKDFNKITELTNDITGISSNTNLLALNASIEAARAGEAGKGFAVVAEQIRELSASTASLVSGIEKSIQTLFETLDNLQKDITKTSDMIQANVKEADEVKNDFKQIQSCTQEVKEVSNQIIQKIDQTSTQIEDASKEVDVAANAIEGIIKEVESLNNNRGEKFSYLGDITDILNQMHNISYEK